MVTLAVSGRRGPCDSRAPSGAGEAQDMLRLVFLGAGCCFCLPIDLNLNVKPDGAFQEARIRCKQKVVASSGNDFWRIDEGRLDDLGTTALRQRAEVVLVTLFKGASDPQRPFYVYTAVAHDPR